jgi:heat shock protein HslJ
MKKNLIVLSMLFALLACKTQKMKKEIPTPPKTVNVAPPPPLEEPKIADESPVPFFYAVTDEGAVIEILQGMDASLDVKMVVMGETVVNGNLKKTDNLQMEEYTNDKTGKQKITLILTKENCVDSKEKQYQTKFSLVANNKTYKGCGNRHVDMPRHLSGKYYLLAIKDKEMQDFEQNEINIDVFRSQVNAYFGCNRLGGNFIADDKKASFLQLFSTMMYCDRKMEWEDYFKNITPTIATYKNNDYGIIFYDAKGDKVMEFKRR